MKAEKRNIRLYNFIGIIVAIILFCLSGISLLNISNNKQVFAAQNSYDNETEIYENGNIISSSLWNALKRFYNNNKTSEMPSISKGDDDELYLTINMFKNFPNTVLDLSNQEIDSIYNLGIFDLSSFTEINLSKNSIDNIYDELSNIDNLERLDLSDNNINNFSYNQLSENSYKTKLVELNLKNNKLTSCNLSLIELADIDISHNELTKENLTLPNILTLKVKASYNYISNPDLSNENIDFGLQCVKDNKKYVQGQTVEYYGIDDITTLKIYFQKKTTVNDVEQIEETEVASLTIGETYTFGLGYYRVEFVTETQTEETQDILVYIYPQSPTIKMFRDGKELSEIEYFFKSVTTIKFYGEDNARFAYKLNSGDLIFADEIEINKEGINIVNIYQIVTDEYDCEYYSEPMTLFIEYQTKTVRGWIFVIAGSAIFIGTFYFVLKYYPIWITKHLGKKKDKTGKKDLD